METAVIFKIGLLSTISFILAIAVTPALTHFLYKYKLGKQIRDAKDAPIFNKLHQAKAGTPTMGGILFWAVPAFLTVLFYILANAFLTDFFTKMNFLTREQTLLPLGIMILAALIGLLDDFLGIKKIGPKGGGLGIRHRLVLYGVVALIAALWFYFKLDWDVFHIPFIGNYLLGWWYIPVFVLVVSAISHSINFTDGLDGLAGGIMCIAFTAMGAVSFAEGKFELATFCGVIIGALIAFLWFNINPARFIMGDSGAMGLGITLGVMAMYTNTAILMIFFCFIPMIETLSDIIQLTSKKLRHKKVFLSAPIHHHFQAIGWSEPKIVMRFWIIAMVMAVIGLIIFLLDKGWY
jgi:phospho-N-acetylmuramoyl-pentapeptide-transferase